MTQVTKMYFEREVIGTPENCKRVFVAMVVHEGEMVGITLWQDGPWWCMTEESQGKVYSSTWGNAQHIMQELSLYGLQPIIDHIDFSARNFDA